MLLNSLNSTFVFNTACDANPGVVKKRAGAYIFQQRSF